MSLVLKPSLPIQFTPQLTLLTAVALCRAVKQAVPDIGVGIKWPNDLLVGGKKIAGILLESNAEDERLRYVIAGVGISVNLTEDDFPDELKPVATSLRMEAGQPVDRVNLIQLFLQQFEYLYDLYHEQGFAPIRTLWEALSCTLYQQVKVRSGGGFVEGKAVEINEMGALVVQTADGREVKVYSGDVSAP
jgi:BirA family biotin operon repressor/biotin-[acetyl-CoA-carboxylase] ligase